MDVYLYGLTKSNWNNSKSELLEFSSFFDKYNVKFEFDNIF